MQVRHRKMINILTNETKENSNMLVKQKWDGVINCGIKNSVQGEQSPLPESFYFKYTEHGKTYIVENKTVIQIAKTAIKNHHDARNNDLKDSPGTSLDAIFAANFRLN
jgi:hypothetical protein